MAESDDQEEFDAFADSADDDINFGRQDHLRQAAELRAEREGDKAVFDRVVKLLQQKKPKWQEDGLGIRGHVEQVSNSQARLVWPDSGVTRRSDPESNQGDTEVAAEIVEE